MIKVVTIKELKNIKVEVEEVLEVVEVEEDLVVEEVLDNAMGNLEVDLEGIIIKEEDLAVEDNFVVTVETDTPDPV